MKDPEKVKASKRAYYARNKGRERTRARVYAATHAEKIRARKRVYFQRNKDYIQLCTRAWKYGLGVEQLSKILARGKCEICGVADGLVIDHDHATGLVRGLLCRQCNLALGYFNDDPDLLRAAARFLEEEKRRYDDAG